MNNEKINNHANLIWALAEKLTGPFKAKQYGDVILPLTVIRRFDCVLENTKDNVRKVYQGIDPDDGLKDKKLRRASGFDFYNTSKYDLKSLLDDATNIGENFQEYLLGFSENVTSILSNFKFQTTLDTLINKDILYVVLEEISKADLHPNTVSNIEMGYIFEEVLRKFSESIDEAAGEFYTPREVIKLMVNILFDNDRNLLSKDFNAKTIYDPTCGTGGMLTVAEEYIKQLNETAKLITFGQEINDETFAIAKADVLIKGLDAENIKCGNTLKDDQFKGLKFDYIISNPPFGREWKESKKSVEDEAAKGFAGRFGYGTPAVSDSQMLFLCNVVAKMKDPKDGGSRVAIIHNGSPLFTGDAGSGPSEIRKYLLKNDLVEAIISMPNDIFYNTGITVYIWILSNVKDKLRKDKVQLIDGSKYYQKLRKNLGLKKVELSPIHIAEITKLYSDFKETEDSKIFDNEYFGYTKVTVETPIVDENNKPILKKEKLQPNKELKDSESIPLSENIDKYFEENVIPFNSLAYMDRSKDKIGYEIPFTKIFFKFTPPISSADFLSKIKEIEKMENILMEDLFKNVQS